jgi:hypothetical protein
MQANKFTVKSRSATAKGWPGCVEYVVLDPEQKEHGPFNTRPQANAYVAKILGVPLKEALAQIED